ncbi:MAG: response regulator [Rhodospirillales bacterium]|nr:response regulator [Rhodospirillales bacterium]
MLVIDDDELVLEGMGSVLNGWGYRPLLARSPTEALQRLAAEAEPPAIVICDCHLSPAESGIETIAAVRAKAGRQIPAFLMTGDTTEERAREAAAAGLHLLRKPVPPMALRAMMMQLLKAPPLA